MFGQITFGSEFFAALVEFDRKTAELVAEGGCRLCEGPLHWGNYERKPRGGLMAAAGEEFLTRFSLCCGCEGCRRRATPPSVRFLGRRVYLGAVVLVACVIAQALETAEAIWKATGVPARTTRRWRDWWQGAFLGSSVFVALCARLIGVTVKELPASILLLMVGTAEERVQSLLKWLRPLTTGAGIGSRMLRDIA